MHGLEMTVIDKKQPTQKLIEPRDEQYKDSILTVPNVICFIRIVGSFVLIGFAMANWRYLFVGLFLTLSISDWIDGKLARWLHQRSDFGARLDSTADAALYVGLLGGMVILCWSSLQHELVWLAVGISSYAMTTGFGLWKYGRVPSYHTYGAKFTQWLALIAGFCFVLGWAAWPLRLAMISVTLTNIEATLITCVLKEWQADVLTLFHVWPNR